MKLSCISYAYYNLFIFYFVVHKIKLPSFISCVDFYHLGAGTITEASPLHKLITCILTDHILLEFERVIVKADKTIFIYKV